jgi:hypothetical protein
MACPVCNDELGGTSEWPKDEFVDKLIKAHAAIIAAAGDDGKKTSCQLCSSVATAEVAASKSNGRLTAKKNTDDRTPATIYCVQCQQNFCEHCSIQHKKITSLCTHKLVNIGTKLSPKDIVRSLSSDLCPHHPGSRLQSFCADCNAVVCATCRSQFHSAHHCSDLSESSADFRRQMASDRLHLTEASSRCQELISGLSEKINEFEAKISQTKNTVMGRANELKELIDKDRDRLLAELDKIHDDGVAELNGLRQDVGRVDGTLHYVAKYTKVLDELGTTRDIVTVGQSLHERASRLVDEQARKDVSPPSFDVKFVPLKWPPRNVQQEDNVVGKVEAKNVIIRRERFALSARICAMTSSDGRLYVTTIENSTGKTTIKIFDCNSRSLERTLSIPDDAGSRLYGLAVCDRYAFLSDFDNNIVYRLALDTSGSNSPEPDEKNDEEKQTTARKTVKWYVAKNPTGLSMIKDSYNVLVVSWGSALLHEYTADGCIVREIRLPSDVVNPHHAVQLSSGGDGDAGGQYLVSYCGSVHRLCIVKQDGSVAAVYDGPRKPAAETPRGTKAKSGGVGHGHGTSSGTAATRNGSSAAGMRWPRSFAVDRRGRVFIADHGNDRVLVVELSSMDSARILPVSVERPSNLCLDESGERLYVSEGSKGTLLTFVLADMPKLTNAH